MALTREDLQAIAELMDTKLEPIQQDMQDMKSDMLGMKDDMQGMKDDMQSMNDRLTCLEHTVQQTNDKITDTRLHLENVTDWNIRLLAENHRTLIDKLNEAIPAVNKNIVYEVKVNYLVAEVEKLKADVDKLKSATA